MKRIIANEIIAQFAMAWFSRMGYEVIIDGVIHMAICGSGILAIAAGVGVLVDKEGKPV